LQVEESCRIAGRPKDSVHLIAVSKTWPIEKIQPVVETGQLLLGENKLQELEQKAPILSSDLEWHFIGRLQRNKIRKVLAHSDWIHSVSSLKLLHAINRISEEESKKPNIFLQVNIDEEETKGGLLPEETENAVAEATKLNNFTLKGLMAIPKAQKKPEQVRESFKKLARLQNEINSSLKVSLSSLSMGMSSDYHIAVEEGATHIRVGSAIFGNRN